MAHFNFAISQNAKWGHAGFYIDCHGMTVPENILLQISTGLHHRRCRQKLIQLSLRTAFYPLYEQFFTSQPPKCGIHLSTTLNSAAAAAADVEVQLTVSIQL